MENKDSTAIKETVVAKSIIEGCNKYNNKYMVIHNHKYTHKGIDMKGYDRYRCFSKHCKAYLRRKTIGEDKVEIYFYNIHSHEDLSLENSNVSKYHSEIKRLSLSSHYKPTEVVSKLLSNFSTEEQKMLPCIKQLRKKVSSLRSIENIKTSNSLVQFEEFFLSLNKEKFLQADTPNYTLFLNNENIDLFKLSKTWLIDGTFKSCPSEYSQLLVVSFIVHEKPFSGCYVLMKNRLAKLYEDVLNFSMVENAILDFEAATIKGIKKGFPNINICYCLFHFGQNFWRNIQKLGLSTIYNENPLFRTYIKKFLCISFEPPSRRATDLSLLCSNFISIFNEEKFRTSDVTNCIRKVYFNVDMTVNYEIKLEYQLKHNIPLTNDFSKSKNSVLNREFDRIKPSVDVLLRKIQHLDNSVVTCIKMFINKKILNDDQELNSENCLNKNYQNLLKILDHESRLPGLNLVKKLEIEYSFKLQ